VGMGRDLSEQEEIKQIFTEADAALAGVLSEPISKLCWEGPEEKLTETRHCQPALYVHGLACMKAFQHRIAQEGHAEIRPTACAGLSLGEFTAHAAAGTFSIADGLRLVAARGAAMQEACDASPGSMVSLIGATPEQAGQIASKLDVDIANLNCPGQVVLSGLASHLSGAPDVAREMGIKRALPLKVAGAYHSRLMAPAQPKLEHAMASVDWREPSMPVPANFLATPAQGLDAIRRSLLDQVTGSVRWEECIIYLREMGIRYYVEFGPGGVLAGLMKRIDPELHAISVEDKISLDAALAFMHQHHLIAQP